MQGLSLSVGFRERKSTSSDSALSNALDSRGYFLIRSDAPRSESESLYRRRDSQGPEILDFGHNWGPVRCRTNSLVSSDIPVCSAESGIFESLSVLSR